MSDVAKALNALRQYEPAELRVVAGDLIADGATRCTCGECERCGILAMVSHLLECIADDLEGNPGERMRALRDRIVESCARVKEASERMRQSGQVMPDPLIPILGAAVLLAGRLRAVDGLSLLDLLNSDAIFADDDDDDDEEEPE